MREEGKSVCVWLCVCVCVGGVSMCVSDIDLLSSVSSEIVCVGEAPAHTSRTPDQTHSLRSFRSLRSLQVSQEVPQDPQKVPQVSW